MTSAEYQKQYGNGMKKVKPITENKKEIGIMLQLAKINFIEEYKFHATRKWRFDFAIVEKKIAIEYEGIFSAKSRHTTVTGFMGDAEKYNAATKLGWRVLRYTAKDYKNVIQDLKEMI